MNCTCAHAAIQRSLDQTPTQVERLALESHLELCEACRQEYEALRRLTSLADRWVSRTLDVSDPGEQFTAQVISRIAVRPAPSRVRVWLPLSAVLLLTAVLLLLVALAWGPSLSVYLPLPSLLGFSDWLRADFLALSGDALRVFRAPQVSWLSTWTTVLLIGVGLLNAGFCVHARQRSLS